MHVGVASIRLIALAVACRWRNQLHTPAIANAERLTFAVVAAVVGANLTLVAVRFAVVLNVNVSAYVREALKPRTHLALAALEAGVVLGSNADQIALLDVSNLGADLDSNSYDLMSHDLCFKRS